MQRASQSKSWKHSPGMLEGLLLLYLAASLVHFIHNAEFASEYPNLPAWITRSSVYATWLVITAGGLVGYLTYRRWSRTFGVLILCIYAAVGLDGLLHYARAPMRDHSHGMNFTIWFEALSAGLLLLYGVSRLRKTAANTRDD